MLPYFDKEYFFLLYRVHMFMQPTVSRVVNRLVNLEEFLNDVSTLFCL